MSKTKDNMQNFLDEVGYLLGYDEKNLPALKDIDRFRDLPKMPIDDLESELNFYQWLVDHEPELGGVEMKHRVWLEAVKIEVRRRGYVIEKRIKLVKGKDLWEET